MSTVYKKYNFNTTDMRNFLIMLAEEFQKRGKELIPDGLILKHPKPFDNGFNNTYIDIIGIPFKKVYGRTRLYYRRIKLSEFADRYRVQLGTATFPIRLKKSDNEEVMKQRVKSEISKRTGVPHERFIIEKIADTNNLLTYSFKFEIQETEFSSKDSGLSLVNDKPVTIYVAEPNVEIQAGYVKIPAESIITQNPINSTLGIFLKPEDIRNITSLSELYPKQLKLADKRFTEIIPSPIENKVYKNGIAALFEATIPDDVLSLMKNISVTAKDHAISGNKLKLTVRSGVTEYFRFEDQSGKQYSELIEFTGSDKGGLYTIDPITQNSVNSSSGAGDFKSIEFKIKSVNVSSYVSQNDIMYASGDSRFNTTLLVVKYKSLQSVISQNSIMSSSGISIIKVNE